MEHWWGFSPTERQPWVNLDQYGSTQIDTSQHGSRWVNMDQHGATEVDRGQHGSTWINTGQRGATRSNTG